MQPIKCSILLCALLFAGNLLFAQPAESAVTPLEKINEQMNLLNNKYIAYVSEMAHGKKIKKAEKKHQAYMEQITNFRYALAEIPYYKGDKSLHEGTKSYLKLVETIQKEDYGKVVNMEEIAEQSYDAMEAYILFKKKIDEKMADADKEFDKIQKDYCDRNNIQLVEGPKTEMSEKMNAIGTVSDYYDEMYLIFFKASIHDEQMVEAMEAKNLTALEQIKGSLLKYAEEGLAKLDTFRAYKNDGSLRLSCRKAMEFYKKEASMLETVTDYFLKVEDFETVKKNFERNPKAKSDQKEIDKYNAAVKEMNKSLEKFNQTIQSMNKGRADVINNWNETGKRFFDTHMPYGK
ncbi:MAG: hypothetical protein MUE71_06530 [Chitinophagaceae bacterium]|jgi:hypothetical protein|nr:hypothetical protein [Chitinophagaceae bacterium]MCU0403186.1 hypothetical protein [Chitinophagaceae bacterium]